MKTNKTQTDETVSEAAAAGTETERNLGPEAAALAGLQAENEKLKAAIRLKDAHRQITAELSKAGARSPDLLFDAVQGDLQFDGDAIDAAETVERLKARFPEQFGTDRLGSIDGGAGREQGTALTRDAFKRMSAAEIAQLDWEDVETALKG